MCGIAGIHCRNGKPAPNLQRIAEEFLLALEPRGRDAAGFITLEDSGAARLRKDTIPASLFVRRMRKDGDRWGVRRSRQVRTLMVHTRFATIGNPRDPKNAHPHVSNTIAAVHNGTVYNADELFEEYGMTRRATVDSEVVPALVQHLGWANVADALGKLEGGAALGIINQQAPRELVLARVRSFPMHYVATRDFVMWASTPDAIKRAYRAATGRKLKDTILSLNDGEMVFVNKGVLSKAKFKLAPAPKYVTGYSTHRFIGTPRTFTPRPAQNNVLQQRLQLTQGGTPSAVAIAAAKDMAGYSAAWDDVPQDETSGYDRAEPWYDDREVDILELMSDGMSRKLATEIVDESIAFMAQMKSDERVERMSHGAPRGAGDRKGHVETKSPATLADEALDEAEARWAARHDSGKVNA